jgi:hypothetical protein
MIANRQFVLHRATDPGPGQFIGQKIAISRRKRPTDLHWFPLFAKEF